MKNIYHVDEFITCSPEDLDFSEFMGELGWGEKRVEIVTIKERY